MALLPATIKRKYESTGVNCPVIDRKVADLADYFAILTSLLSRDDPFWFRGHSDCKYELVPTALRYGDETKRNTAIQLVTGFRRYAEIKLPKPPPPEDDLKWLQLAQHYGLDTRLLDWTENAAVALYFACQRATEDGAVLIMNPIDLNRKVDPKHPRVFDAHADQELIGPYLSLTGRRNRRGPHTIAIHPILNSERIVLQKGVFTLHGSTDFGIDRQQTPSLVKIPILGRYKAQLFSELDRVGIGEMMIFPELEHLCSYLKTKSQLR